jgi:hypothetical protein
MQYHHYQNSTTATLCGTPCLYKSWPGQPQTLPMAEELANVVEQKRKKERGESASQSIN